ncbi:MAG TPA: SIS domain-containing protein [Acidimicrobiales bacterium]|nr:SIS domain-containing protein [Acidimicrobiales bacterium]
MNEQPRCLASLFARREEIIEQVRALAPRELAGTVLVARGSSDHAATCGAYFLEIASGRPVALTSPSIQTLYRARTDFRGYLMIAASQSGQTPEIVEVVERARAYGARAIAVTNEPASPLAAAADLVVDISAGRERAVPATKTVTAQVAVFATIAQAFGDLGLEARAAERLPGQVGEVLADLSPVEGLAEWLASSDRLLTVARGLLYGAAQEVALKVEETTARLTAAFSAADLRHGPIAIATSGAPVLAFVHPGPAASDVSDVVGDLRSRGAPTRVLGPVPGADFGWSSDVPEVLAPVLAIVRGQQLALSLARLLGLNPDAPAGLTKVTIT